MTSPELFYGISMVVFIVVYIYALWGVLPRRKHSSLRVFQAQSLLNHFPNQYE